MFIETSAKAGHNVKTLFRKIAQALPGMEREGEAAGTQNQSECIPLSREASFETRADGDFASVIDVSITPQNTTTNESSCSC